MKLLIQFLIWILFLITLGVISFITVLIGFGGAVYLSDKLSFYPMILLVSFAILVFGFIVYRVRKR